MEPERSRKYADYLLSDGQRESLMDDSSLGRKNTNKAEEIKNRARNIPLRIQYLIEDIELLHRASVLDALDLQGIKADLEEIDPPVENRNDFILLQHELDHPSGVNVSSFGLALGHLLSRIYPGDPTEQTRLWWGLTLGYFGHTDQTTPQPYVNSDITTKSGPIVSGEQLPEEFPIDSTIHSAIESPPEYILLTVLKKYSEQERDDFTHLQRAYERAISTLENFGQILYDFFTDDVTIKDVTDLSLEIQAVIVATTWEKLNERSLTDAYYRYFRHVKESELDLIEEAFPMAVDTPIETITQRYVDLELLIDIDKLCRCVVSDRQTIDNHKGRGVAAVDVFKFLWNTAEPQYAGAVNKKIQKGANNVKWMLNELANQGENRSNREWCFSPPVLKTADGFELSQYGELLAHLYFESEQPCAELYALAFNEDVRSAFDIDDRLPALVDDVVDNDVPFNGST